MIHWDKPRNDMNKYDELIAVIISCVVLYFCVQELIINILFSQKDIDELNKTKNENGGKE